MNILLLILFVLLVLVGVASLLKRAPRYAPGFLAKALLGLLLVVIILMAMTGRLHWLAAVAAVAFPLLKQLMPLLLPLLRFLPFIRQRQQAGNKSAGQQSEVSTRWLVMRLDHDTGTVTGDIIDGPFKGDTLDDLSISELAQLYEACQHEDTEAIRLLDSYIQRHRTEEWQAYFGTSGANGAAGGQQSPGSGTASDGEMTEKEALSILGLEAGASREEILQAHKRMMARMHPDKGGSNYLASKINQAKELLLGRL